MLPDVSRMNMTLGFGLLAGFGLIRSSSVSSAKAGEPDNNARAHPVLVHVNFCAEIFMIRTSIIVDMRA